MKVTSTGDVSLDVLSELVPDLSPEIDLEVERAQYQFRTLEPPSFVTFLAQCEWWVQLCAAYAASILRKSRRRLERKRGRIVTRCLRV